MVFIADDLGAWLVAALADAGRRRLTTVVLGRDQERALRRAATTAVQLTAGGAAPGEWGTGRGSRRDGTRRRDGQDDMGGSRTRSW